ncbi:MAG: Rrf2 family transcriptional regulator [Deltaproteobacteria bacterium]|jgi:Rrf2 family protein|nr:Rrf2 family transcriptional regulator [Deltaproteobacteria bacterium]MBQ32854.1 Rrf2 family transcriptional regulator [Deltaproteobacteria bacterium]MDP7158972.1 Rrf2 family transcriptional regulator [SAR324 cluster bacterium]
MLKLSKKTDYAIILLTHLGEMHMPVSAQELSAHYRLPHPMTANILKQLVTVGMTESVRGQHGGYVLARPAEGVTLAEIVQVMDGPFTLVDCVHQEEGCKVSQCCSTRGALIALHRRMEQFMEETTLASIIAESQLDLTSQPSQDHGTAHLS